MKSKVFYVLISAWLIVLVSCISINELAPPVDTLMGSVKLNIANNDKIKSLKNGRKLYIGKCAKCHAIEPVKKYSVKQWDKIIPPMAKKTKLNRKEIDDLEKYIYTALKR